MGVPLNQMGAPKCRTMIGRKPVVQKVKGFTQGKWVKGDGSLLMHHKGAAGRTAKQVTVRQGAVDIAYTAREGQAGRIAKERLSARQ